MIYIGADHRGYKLKQKLVEFLSEKGHEVLDMGTDSEESVDYPLIAEKVAREVVKHTDHRGILICGGGGGVCIAANKVKGVRAYQAWDEQSARATRKDDNGNVLCLSADMETFEEAQLIVLAFLETAFESVERRVRRLKQIEDIEQS